MKRLFSLSIRTHLLLLVVLATLPALAVIVYRGVKLRELAVDNAKSEVLRVEQALAFQQLRAVENAHQLLLTLARLPQFQRLDKQECESLLRRLLRENPDYANLLVALPDGKLFASAVETKPFSIADRQYFRNLLTTRDISIGAYSISRTTGKPVMQFAYPLTDERGGRLRAVLVASYNLGNLGQIFSRANLPPGSVLAMTDPDGMRVYRYPEPGRYGGKPDYARIYRKMAGTAAEGCFLSEGVDGVFRLYCFRKLLLRQNSSPLFMRVGVPYSTTIEKVQALQRQNLLFLALAAALSLLIAWAFSHLFIVRRVNRLVAATCRVGRGELHARTGLSRLDGELGCLAGSFDDMAEALQRRESERLETEKSLQEQLEIQKALLLGIPALVYVKNREFVYQQVNRLFAEFAGMPADHIVGKTDFDLFPEESARMFRETDQEVSRSDTPRLNLEMQLDHPELGTIWLSTNKAPIHDAHGAVVGIVGISVDITDRLIAENALREREKQLNLVLEGSNDAFWDWDMVTNRVQRNARWTQMLGYRPDEIDTTVDEWKRLVHPEDLPAARLHLREYLAGRVPQYRLECRMLSKSGEWKWLVDRGKVVERDETGRPLRMAGTATDISDRKKAEQENRQLSEQLRHAQKLEAIGQLTGGIAHDFNNILTVIIGCSHLALMQGDRQEKVKGFVEQILAAADRAAGLTQSLLAFSRKQIQKTRAVDLNEIIGKLEKLLRRLIGEDVELRVSLHPAPLVVMADPGQIEQILMNLAANARDAMPGGGILSIRTDVMVLDKGVLNPIRFEMPVQFASVTVSDNGCGMDEATRQKVFEPFFTTKDEGQGTGLGLSIVNGIVKQHKGYLTVQSELGTGTSFRIFLPAGPPDAGSDQPSLPAGPVRGTETILLAEDEADVRSATRGLLEIHGYRVIEAADGESALRLFMEHREEIQLVLLDVVMPKMNGREVYHAIRESSPDMAVVYMSGYSNDILDRNRILEDRARFIGKPFSREALLKTIREVFDA